MKSQEYPTREPEASNQEDSGLDPAQPESDPELTPTSEEQALALLEHRDLTSQAIQKLITNTAILKSRKVRLALASHPNTPHHLTVRLLRHLYNFDLMQFALKPAIAADLKRAAERLLISGLRSMTPGERLTLARRGSTAVAAELLLDSEKRVFQTALDNGRMNQAAIIRALSQPTSSPGFVAAVCTHGKWSLRKEIRMALMRNQYTSFTHALEFARSLPSPVLKDVLYASRLPDTVKNRLREKLTSKK